MVLMFMLSPNPSAGRAGILDQWLCGRTHCQCEKIWTPLGREAQAGSVWIRLARAHACEHLLNGVG